MTEKFSKLELVWRNRKGGHGKTQRDYLDFVVNGKSLSDLLKTGDNIGCLGWLPPASEQMILEQLTAKRLSDLGNDRYSIYICPECADIGCGAITVQIEKTQNGFVWRNFGYENNYDEAMQDLESYEMIGGFHFSEAEYLQALTTKPLLKRESS